jgi:hypothetical protein
MWWHDATQDEKINDLLEIIEMLHANGGKPSPEEGLLQQCVEKFPQVLNILNSPRFSPTRYKYLSKNLREVIKTFLLLCERLCVRLPNDIKTLIISLII